MLFRTGAKGFAAHVPRDATPIFFPEKENGRRPSKRKAFYIGSLDLEELHALRNRVRCTWLRHESLRIVTVLQPRLTIVRRE